MASFLRASGSPSRLLPSTSGPRRWYGLRIEPLTELDDWLAPYRWMWESNLDRLGAHLDEMPEHAKATAKGDSHVS